MCATSGRSLRMKPFGFEIERLSADHAGVARRDRERQDQFGAHAGVGMARGIAQQFERQRLQSVAGQNRAPLVIGFPNRRAAAAHLVVVHSRQIVVHQRITVDAFDGGRRVDRVVAWQRRTAPHFQALETAGSACRRRARRGGWRPIRRAGTPRSASRVRTALKPGLNAASRRVPIGRQIVAQRPLAAEFASKRPLTWPLFAATSQRHILVPGNNQSPLRTKPNQNKTWTVRTATVTETMIRRRCEQCR